MHTRQSWHYTVGLNRIQGLPSLTAFFPPRFRIWNVAGAGVEGGRGTSFRTLFLRSRWDDPWVSTSWALHSTPLDILVENPTIIASINRKGNGVPTTISSTYQVLIPKPVREHPKPKQTLTVIEKDKMPILIPQASLDDLRGIAAGARVTDHREKKDQVTCSLLVT